MKNLLLMRHAKSSWKNVSIPDHQRPLNKRGKGDAPRMGKHLQSQDIPLDAILCSTALRARETANGFLKEYTFEGEVLYVDDLYQADPATIMAVLRLLPEQVETAMVIGHNPGLDDFLELVCDEYEHMPTACIAYVTFHIDQWVNLHEITRGGLVHFWKVREI